MRRGERVTRGIWFLAATTLAASVVAVVVFIGATLTRRLPYWGEAEVLFEASRIRAGLPLFVDPLTGAFEHGAPPSRYYVTYPPLLSLALAAVPASGALVAGRVASTAAWLGTLAWIAFTARRELRATAAAAAAFVGGIWILANFASVGRPDAIACALAGVGLVRAIRSGRIDVWSCVLLALAPWVKPTLIGVPVGAVVVASVAGRTVRPLAMFAAFALAIGAVAVAASDGALIEHVLRSNAQPFRLEVWLEHVPGRLPFFAPLFAVALWNGRGGGSDPGVRIGIGALGGGAAWCLVALAKTGSAANYWMEPCVAAVALLAHARGPFVFGRSDRPHDLWTAVTALATIAYTDAASIPTSLRRAAEYRRDAEFVATIRSRCGAGPSGVIAADEQGIELALDGRILVPAYQMAWLVNAGSFPADVWTADLASPNVRCVVLHSGDLRAAPAVLEAIEASFTPSFTDGAFRVLVRRER